MTDFARANPWTDEIVERLRALFERSMSSRMIADELGMTRNQVIGKLHRLGLRNPYPTETLDRTVTRRPSAPRPRVVNLDPVTPLHLSLDALQPNNCRYPYGEGPFTFCGCQTIPDASYCGPHYALTHSNTLMTPTELAIHRRAHRARMIAEAA